MTLRIRAKRRQPRKPTRQPTRRFTAAIAKSKADAAAPAVVMQAAAPQLTADSTPRSVNNRQRKDSYPSDAEIYWRCRR